MAEEKKDSKINEEIENEKSIENIPQFRDDCDSDLLFRYNHTLEITIGEKGVKAFEEQISKNIKKVILLLDRIDITDLHNGLMEDEDKKKLMDMLHLLVSLSKTLCFIVLNEDVNSLDELEEVLNKSNQALEFALKIDRISIDLELRW